MLLSTLDYTMPRAFLGLGRRGTWVGGGAGKLTVHEFVRSQFPAFKPPFSPLRSRETVMLFVR